MVELDVALLTFVPPVLFAAIELPVVIERCPVLVRLAASTMIVVRCGRCKQV